MLLSTTGKGGSVSWRTLGNSVHTTHLSYSNEGAEILTTNYSTIVVSGPFQGH